MASEPSSADFIQAIANQSRYSIFAIDNNMHVRMMNSANARFFKSLGIEMKVGGYFPSILEVLPEMEKKQKLAHLIRALQGERFSTLETFKEVYYQTEYAPLYDEKGKLIGAVFVGRTLDAWDVTEVDEYCPVVNGKDFFWPHVVLFGRDPMGKSFSKQPSWESFTGQSYEDYTGFGWFNAFHPEYRKHTAQIWRHECDVRQKPRAFSFMSCLWNAKMQMYRYILIHATPQFDVQGNMAYWTCAGIDLHVEEERIRLIKREEEIRAAKQAEEHERKRAEEAEENQRKQEEFIDTVCHEIRNPLVGIYGSVHLASEEMEAVMNGSHQFDSATAISLQRIKTYIKSIRKCAEQQKIILDDVLDMSKIQHNKVTLIPVAFQLASCFDKVTDMFQSRLQEKNLVLKTKIPSEAIFLKADLNRIQQVLINLVSNAVKFTHEGEINITVNVNQSNLQWTLEVQVEDTGIGIASEELPLLFNRFSQVGYQRYGGSGLGLAISKTIVNSMGGDIVVSSTLDVGTIFKFQVNVDPASESDIAKLMTPVEDIPQEGDKAQSSMNILVVDDNSLNQRILVAYLEKVGHRIHTASDGLEAVEHYSQQHFDIIFMDIEMPNMNGMEATQKIREQEQNTQANTVIIGVSGNARKEKIQDALKSGMDSYVTKPYDKEEILKVVSKYGKHSKALKTRKNNFDESERASKHVRFQ